MSKSTLLVKAWTVPYCGMAGFWWWQPDGFSTVWGPLAEEFMWAESKKLAAKLGFDRIEINKTTPPKWWSISGAQALKRSISEGSKRHVHEDGHGLSFG